MFSLDHFEQDFLSEAVTLTHILEKVSYLVTN